MFSIVMTLDCLYFSSSSSRFFVSVASFSFINFSYSSVNRVNFEMYGSTISITLLFISSSILFNPIFGDLLVGVNGFARAGVDCRLIISTGEFFLIIEDRRVVFSIWT